jgi:voltage-gated potassium channel
MTSKQLTNHPLTKWFNKNRFTILCVSLLMFFMMPSLMETFIDAWVSQAIYLSIITLASINLMQTRQKKILFSILALVGSIILSATKLSKIEGNIYEKLVFGIFIIYFSMIAYNLFKQFKQIKKVDESMIIASISGYLLLGTLAFLAFCMTEVLQPGSFTNTQTILSQHSEIKNLFEMTLYSKHIISDLFYFSFISMSTIGYGDIYPVSQVARKLSVLVGIIGPFYMAIVVASIVGLFMNKPETEK